MKITNIQFSILEKATLYAKAGATLTDKGLSAKEVIEVLETLTPPNVLRLALGFDQRERGGRRSGAGWPKGKKRKVKK
jgi:hypothetical protein